MQLYKNYMGARKEREERENEERLCKKVERGESSVQRRSFKQLGLQYDLFKIYP